MNGDALTTKERIKTRLTLTVATFDSLIDSLILAVTARIQQATDRRFIQATYTNELHNGSDIYGSKRAMLILKNGPVQSVATVQEKLGTNTVPNWTTIDANDYTCDLSTGMILFHGCMPSGMQNVRVTYTGGYSGYTIGVNNFWVFNSPVTGLVNGSNLTFTLPETADQVIIYADGAREVSSNVTFTAGTDTFTLAAGRAPYSTIVVDYKKSVVVGLQDFNLPADLVDVCERAVVLLFKRRDSEGKSSETFQESSISYRDDVFTKEMQATIRNYRRGYNL